MDRFLEEQEVELSQSMIPQVQDLGQEFSCDADKTHTNVFSTGKPTIYSPSKQFDRSVIKSNCESLGLKRSHHQIHEEVNGRNNVDQNLDNCTKKPKIDTISLLGEIHTSKKDLDVNKETTSPSKYSLENHRESPRLPFSSHPLPSHEHLSKLSQASEIEGQPVHINLISDHPKGQSSNILENNSKIIITESVNGFTRSEDNSTGTLSSNSPCKNPSLIVSKQVDNSIDLSNNIDISKCVRKPLTAEPAMI